MQDFYLENGKYISTAAICLGVAEVRSVKQIIDIINQKNTFYYLFQLTLIFFFLVSCSYFRSKPCSFHQTRKTTSIRTVKMAIKHVTILTVCLKLQ